MPIVSKASNVVQNVFFLYRRYWLFCQRKAAKCNTTHATNAHSIDNKLLRNEIVSQTPCCVVCSQGSIKLKQEPSVIVVQIAV